jgi:Fe-S cluster assembly protein SufD
MSATPGSGARDLAGVRRAADAPSPHLAALLERQASVPPSALAWLNDLRAAALEHALSLALPSTRDEDWRFTDPGPLLRRSFQPAPEPGVVPDGFLDAFALPEAAARLVFVDGRYVARLSTACSGPGFAGTLADALDGDAGWLQPALGRHVSVEADVYAAVNTAYLQQAAVVRALRGVALSGPVHVVHVSTRPDAVQYARVLVVAERSAEVTLVEEYVGIADAPYFVNGVTEIAVGDGARVHHVRVQRDAPTAFSIGRCGVTLGRDAAYRAQSLALGASMSRYNLDVRLAAPGGQCEIDGLALIGSRQLADTHSLLDHAAPACRSRQVHRCVLAGAAHAVFNGRILVRQGAQRSDSAQESRTLLVGERAVVDTKPQLEIFADDVKCAHGAAVGQIDADQVFYLRSRGLDERSAREILTYAFAAEVAARIPVASLRSRIEALLHAAAGKG